MVEDLEEEILQVLEYHLALELVQQELLVKVMLVVMETTLHLYILVVAAVELEQLVQMEHLVKVEMVVTVWMYLLI